MWQDGPSFLKIPHEVWSVTRNFVPMNSDTNFPLLLPLEVHRVKLNSLTIDIKRMVFLTSQRVILIFLTMSYSNSVDSVWIIVAY